MSISPENIEILENKNIIPTSNDKYVISEDYDLIFTDPELKVLGFIKDRMYIYTDNYISKYTVSGNFISRLYIEVEHGTFNDNVPFMYLFYENKLYKVSENLVVEWVVKTEDYIRHINMDTAGNVYIIFEHGRNIHKYDKNGHIVSYYYYGGSISSTCRFYKTYISPGRTFLYVIGTSFYNGGCECFILKYNTRKGELLEYNKICDVDNVEVDSEDYEFSDIYVDGDYIYIKGINFIQKVNIKMQLMWKHMLAYNEISSTFNKLTSIEYDNSSYHDFIYFCEDLYDTNGYAYGKITTNGNLLWKYTCPENSSDIEFNIAVDNEYIYAWNKESIQAIIPSILAVNNNSLLFETRNGKLIKLLEYNREIYTSEYFNAKRLYADEIITNIPEKIYIPLLYHIGKDYGVILNENNQKILLGYENKFTLTDENYAYRRLIADIIDDANYIKSHIKTSSGRFLITKNGNRIRTKEPYKIENSYDVLCTKQNREVLITTKGEEILRKAGKPYAYYGLLADYFKFYSALITKKTRKPVITKKDKNYICKKTHDVYKYYFRRLKDINLLVEFILQNDVLSTMYPNYIEKLKHHTFTALSDVQKASCPSYYDLKTIKVDKYTYDANTFYITENYVSVFLSKNLPFIKKKEYEPLDIRSMADMVVDETITPFIMFINGRVIKWSNITIVRDWHESYIIIENMNDDTVYSDKVDCIIYPCSIHYGEDSAIDENNNTGLYFSDDGLFTTNIEKIAMRIEVLDEDIISTTQRIDADKKYIEMDLEKGKLANESNIFVFDNGLFDSDNRYYLQNTGYNIFGYNKPSEYAVFRTFYHIKGLDSKNMVFKLINTENVKQDAKGVVSGNATKQYLSTLNYKFDFKFSREKTYDRNIAEAIDYVSSYDISLLMSYYKKQSNIETVALTGVEVNEKATNGILTIPKYSRSFNDDNIIIYKNGLLYDEYKNIQINRKSFTVPVSGFLDDDILEIVHFKNTHNKNYKIKITNNTPIQIASYFRYNNFLLFANAQDGNYPDDAERQYDVDFEYINYFKNNVYEESAIKLNNTYFYNQILNIVGKRQFHYQHFDEIPTNKIFTLDSKFKFAHNIDKYIVFVNGYRIDNDSWNLVLSDVNQIQIISDITGYVDIFYVPDACDEISIGYYNTKFGLGDVDIPENENFDLPFDKDVFFVYVNGVKIPLTQIDNIDKNSFRIIGKTDIIENLSICKYIQSDVIMKELFSYEELWSNGTQTLTKDIYDRVFSRL